MYLIIGKKVKLVQRPITYSIFFFSTNQKNNLRRIATWFMRIPFIALETGCAV